MLQNHHQVFFFNFKNILRNKFFPIKINLYFFIIVLARSLINVLEKIAEDIGKVASEVNNSLVGSPPPKPKRSNSDVGPSSPNRKSSTGDSSSCSESKGIKILLNWHLTFRLFLIFFFIELYRFKWNNTKLLQYIWKNIERLVIICS